MITVDPDLNDTNYDLDLLLDHLACLGAINTVAFENVRCVLSADQEQFNRKKARAFAHVVPGKRLIYCSEAIEMLPGLARLGVLFHEVGHLHLKAFAGDPSEVAVDLWCSGLPGTGYSYKTVLYRSPRSGVMRQATNVQTVSSSFRNKVRS